MYSSEHEDKIEPLRSEHSSLHRPEEPSCPYQEAKLIEHLKQIAAEGDFVELPS